MNKHWQNVREKVRTTVEKQNREIDEKISHNVEKYRGPSENIISSRIEELKNEWDVERYLEVNGASFVLGGLLMGTMFGRKWFFLSGVVSGFLLQQGLKGWNPTVPLLKAMGIRTREEIDKEIYALKVLRGDFDNVSADAGLDDVMGKLGK